jgi:hypothetical protein
MPGTKNNLELGIILLHGLRLNDANVSNIMLNIGYPLDLAGNIRVYIYDINMFISYIYIDT